MLFQTRQSKLDPAHLLGRVSPALYCLVGKQRNGLSLRVAGLFLLFLTHQQGELEIMQIAGTVAAFVP